RTAIAAALRGHPGSPPTPFVFLKTAAKVADGQQRDRLIEVRVGKILSQFKRSGIARQGLIVAVERLQCEAAIVLRLDVIPGERQGSGGSGDRLCVAATVEQTYTAVVMRRRTDGRCRRRGFKIGDSLLVAT